MNSRIKKKLRKKSINKMINEFDNYYRCLYCNSLLETNNIYHTFNYCCHEICKIKYEKIKFPF